MINTLFVSVLQRWDRNLERIGKKQKKNNFMEDVFKLTRCSSFDRYLIKKILESHGNSRIIFSSKWCHQKTSFISKWLYIFALKNRNKRNLPLLLHLISAPFCSVSQSRVPTLMQSYCFILKCKQMH